jgi:hypothetical protein
MLSRTKDRISSDSAFYPRSYNREALIVENRNDRHEILQARRDLRDDRHDP